MTTAHSFSAIFIVRIQPGLGCDLLSAKVVNNKVGAQLADLLALAELRTVACTITHGPFTDYNTESGNEDSRGVGPFAEETSTPLDVKCQFKLRQNMP